MQPLFEHRIEIAGHRTRALELEGEGPPILLLHGWGDSADTWRPLLAELGKFDRRTLAIDLPGTRVELIEGCGHCPQLEATSRLLELLIGFPEPVLTA
jgi:pimeloyl-ACP methyl ester carboxylesterase